MASVHRVRRIIRKFDPWTVLKVSFVFYAVLALGLVLGLVIFWSFVNAAGYPDTIEGFLADIGLWEAGESPLVPEGEFLFRATIFLSMAWAVLMTGLTTLAAVMYNLISDVVGGVEVVVLEETLTTPVAAPARTTRQVQSWQTPSPSDVPDNGPSEQGVEPFDIPTRETSQVRARS